MASKAQRQKQAQKERGDRGRRRPPHAPRRKPDAPEEVVDLRIQLAELRRAAGTVLEDLRETVAHVQEVAEGMPNLGTGPQAAPPEHADRPAE